MARSLPLALAALAALVPSIPRPTGACSPVPEDNGPLAPDPAYASDTTAPGPVTVTYDVYRSDPDGGGGCGTVNSCGGGFNTISLNVVAADDAAPADQLGYRAVIVGGQPPRGLRIPSDDRVAGYGGELNWFFDASYHGGFSVDVELRAVDLNGNVGPATVVTLSDGPT